MPINWTSSTKEDREEKEKRRGGIDWGEPVRERFETPSGLTADEKERERELAAGEQTPIDETLKGWFKGGGVKTITKMLASKGVQKPVETTYKATKGIFNDAVKRFEEASDTLSKGHSGAERAGKISSMALGIANVLFSPVSAAAAGLEEIPIVQYPAAGARVVLEQVAKLAGNVATWTLDHSNNSQEFKDAMREPVNEAAGLAAQLYTFKSAADLYGKITGKKTVVDLTLEEVGRALQKDKTLSKNKTKAVEDLFNDPKFKEAGAIQQAELLKLTAEIKRTQKMLSKDKIEVGFGEERVSATEVIGKAKPEFKQAEKFKEMKPEELVIGKGPIKVIEKTVPIENLRSLKQGEVLRNPEMGDLIVESTRPTKTATGLERIARVFEKGDDNILEVTLEDLKNYKKVEGKIEPIPESIKPTEGAKPIIKEGKVVSKVPETKGEPMAGKANAHTGDITIDSGYIKEVFPKWKERHPESVIKDAPSLERFVIEHEKAHLKYPRKEGEAPKIYEQRINEAAFDSYSKPITKRKAVAKKITEKKASIVKRATGAIKKRIARSKAGKIYSDMKKALEPIKNLKDQVTKDLFYEHNKRIILGKENAGEIGKRLLDITTKKSKDGRLTKISDKESHKIVDNYEAGIKGEYTERINKEFKELYQKETEAFPELNIREVKNYVPHRWVEKGVKLNEAVAEYLVKERGMDKTLVKEYMEGKELAADVATSLNINPTFSFERIFPDYKTGEAYGLNRLYDTPAELLADGYAQLNLAKTNRTLLTDLIKEGKLIEGGKGVPHGWKEVIGEFTRDTKNKFYAEPDLASAINGMFKAESKVWSRTALVSRYMQEIALSAGIPFTDINFFSFGYLARELARGNVKAIVPFIRANFTKRSVAWFNDPVRIQAIKELAGKGRDMSNRVGGKESFYGTFRNVNGFWPKISEVWRKAWNEKTFNSYVQQVHLDAYIKMRDAFKKTGKSQAEAIDFAFNNTASLYGIKTKLGRSKNLENIISTTFFAPKFRESLINVTLNAFKAVTHPRNINYRASRRLVAGVATTYVLTNALNYALNGYNMWDNPENQTHKLRVPLTKDKTMYIDPFPGLTYIPRATFGAVWELTKHKDIKKATQKVGGAFSIPIKTFAEIAANKNYFGEPIWMGSKETNDPAELDSPVEQVQKGIFYLVDSFNHPYPREMFEMALQHKDPLEGIAEMLEAPVKFKDVLREKRAAVFLSAERLSIRLANIIPEHRVEIIREEMMKFTTKEDRLLLSDLMQSRGFLDDAIGISNESLQEWLNDPDRPEEIKKLTDAWPADTELSEDNIFYGKNILEQLPMFVEAFRADPLAVLKHLMPLDKERKERIRKITQAPDDVWWKFGKDIVVFEREKDLYKMDYGDKTTEVDHILPMWLGGDNQAKNLKIMSVWQKMNKDHVEMYLMKEWKAGRITKREAKSMMKRWETVYRTMTEKDHNETDSFLHDIIKSHNK